MNKYCGIDLSKNKFDANYLKDDMQERKREVSNNLSGITKFLDSLPQDIILCAEHTGSYGDLLLFLANQYGIRIAFVSGYEMKHSLGLVKGKSDPIDAKRIREYAERFCDKLKYSHFASENLSELKELSTTRRQLVKVRKQLVTAQKSIEAKPMQSIQAHKSSAAIVEKLTLEIEAIEKDIHRIIMDDNQLSKNYLYITSIIGVAEVIGTALIIKTGNFQEIDTARKAASFAGVCPFPNSSGKMSTKSKTSPLADKELKSLLHMAAKTAVRHNVEYSLYYQKKKNEGKPHFVIMNNIANKILRTAYSLVQNKEKFNKNYICTDPRTKSIA